jgi:hypothetical protein
VLIKAASRTETRRQAIRFPFRNRWLAVKVRTKIHLSEMWADLIYLVKG